jgi:benzoyl-CoA reductase/2-hydroxyglutaryl-CoA dehydratase subunit BcrC/BadD/HgdB
MKTIAYCDPFVPAEWIAAHEMRPSRIMPSTAPASGAAIGMCPYARSFVSEIASRDNVDAVVLTTTCDQMRRASETIASSRDVPVFLFNVPATWQTTTAYRIYGDELKRLGRFLVRLGGTAPSRDELARTMVKYEAARSTILAAQGRLSARQFSQALADFQCGGKADLEALDTAARPRGVPVALVGGPLLRGHFDLFDWIERTGGYVALDATTSGERTLPAPFDRRELGDDPFATLVNAYFGSIPDVFRRPNSELYRRLKQEIVERDIRGVVFRYYTWCDLWHAEASRLKEWLGLPLLVLVAGDEEGLDCRDASRIQSFLEILK